MRTRPVAWFLGLGLAWVAVVVGASYLVYVQFHALPAWWPGIVVGSSGLLGAAARRRLLDPHRAR